MDRRRFLALTLCVLLLSSCGGGGGAASGSGRSGGSSDGPVGRVPPPYNPGGAVEPDEPFEWRSFCSYPDSLSTQPQNLVARTESEYEEAWSLMMHEPQLGPGIDPVPKRPEIDLEKEIVVAVFLGNWQGHCRVRITNVFRVADRVRVEYEIQTIGPEPNAPYSRPYDSIVMTRVEGEVTFSGKVVVAAN